MSVIFTVTFTDDDVAGIAAEHGIAERVAQKRARSWGSAIGDTLRRLGDEQLTSVIVTDEP